MGVKTRRIFVMIAVTVISLFWIKGNGLALLLEELFSGNVLAKLGIFFLSLWLVIWLIVHIFTIISDSKLQPFLVIACLLVWLGMLFLFPSVRNILNNNINLQIFWWSIIFFDGLWIFLDIIQTIKEIELPNLGSPDS